MPKKELFIRMIGYIGGAYLVFGTILMIFHNSNITGLSIFEDGGAGANIALGGLFFLCGISALFIIWMRKKIAVVKT